ncbi:MAG: peptide chain release factor 1 [Candidatus Cloacimonetes bacterium]|nr:peptide chain release factor 1 [Candidatus Cloacimonadota bacterium]MCF7813867.1 peptide chain release factor 1 [Candidatus Cloacimonadota bacterium]MCF7869453.1 peptide chain release factor 1 [Candidatus Cloacimonadota bacterium]MCF7883979.1 peptide chain release factor 1 [Candidatus Cloacimonadota bacterium]
MIPEERIKEIKAEYEELKVDIMDPGKMSDRRYYSKISRQFKYLEEILQCYKVVKELDKSLTETKEMIQNESDPEMKELAREEVENLEAKFNKKFEELKDLLAPRDPNDDKDAIVEIRAGSGGDEAAIFVADLYRMYCYYADKQGWKKTIISSNPIGVGGYKEIIFSLSGNNVYGTMRFESGVHRVQRVPVTESQGRVHTSAISVAVLPEADDVEIEIDPNDLKIDVYRSSGHGGQSVNTTDSAVRITHLPTGLVVTCQDEKSQLKNKAKAMNVLRSRLLDMEISKQEAEISAARKSQVGTGDRSAKIRTYNFPQSRVTDHRINLTSYKLNNILLGDLDEFIEALKIAYKNEMMNG